MVATDLSDELDSTPASTGRAPIWKPGEKGDKIIGTVLDVRRIEVKDRTPLVIEVDAETVVSGGEDWLKMIYAVFCGQALLEKEIVRLAPRRGDRIAIRYDGTAETAKPGKSAAKLFTVKLQAPDGAVNPLRPILVARPDDEKTSFFEIRGERVGVEAGQEGAEEPEADEVRAAFGGDGE